MEVQENKKCTKCFLIKSTNEFHKSNKVKSGVRSNCKLCRSSEKNSRDYRKEYDRNKDHILIYQKQYRGRFDKYTFNRKKTLAKYGLSEETYSNLLSKQEGKCAICKESWNRKLFIDHCHSSGNIRGLLCRKCNSGIGFLKDSPIIVKSALEYLNAAKKVQS